MVKYILSILATLKDHSSRATVLRTESNFSLCAEETSRSLKIRLASYMTTCSRPSPPSGTVYWSSPFTSLVRSRGVKR